MGIKRGKSSKSKKSKKRTRKSCCIGDPDGDNGCYDMYFRPLMAEFIGTTIFVFLITMSLTTDTTLTTAAVQGLALAFLAVGFGNISGAHLNPAVTIAVVLTGNLKFGLGFFYILFQLAGAIGGTAITRGILTEAEYDAINGGNTSLSPETSVVEGFVIEAILAFILVITILVAAVDYKAPTAAIAIGFALLVDVIIALDKTGASVNPARSFGPAVISTFDSTDQWDDQWVYWVGPILGGVLASVVYRFVLADPSNRKMCAHHKQMDDHDSETDETDDE